MRLVATHDGVQLYALDSATVKESPHNCCLYLAAWGPVHLPTATAQALMIAQDTTSKEKATPLMYMFGGSPSGQFLRFQFRPTVAGHNGINQKVLLSCVVDGLRYVQSQQKACPENDTCIDRTLQALSALEERSARREADGVKGTDKDGSLEYDARKEAA